MNRYIKGATVKLVAEFRVDDVLADPTEITLLLKDPTGLRTTHADVVKASTGIYYKTVQVSTAGDWHYRWEGTGEAAGVGEGALYVDSGQF